MTIDQNHIMDINGKIKLIDIIFHFSGITNEIIFARSKQFQGNNYRRNHAIYGQQIRKLGILIFQQVEDMNTLFKFETKHVMMVIL